MQVVCTKIIRSQWNFLTLLSTLKWGPLNSLFSLTCRKDHSIMRQKNESPTNKLFRLFAEIASGHSVYTLLLEKQYVSPGNTKLSWVVINELRKKMSN